MGCELKHESTTPPKLSLFSLPTKPPEPLGLLTPPLQAPASVPFQWEEAPGKPRECTTAPKPRAARCLELPPRLLPPASRVSDSATGASPTTVLDGPQVSRSLSFNFSFRKGSLRREAKEAQFGSSRRWSNCSGSKENREVGEGIYSSSFTVGEEVKITRVRRRRWRSPLDLYPTSQLLASIYEGFKQVIRCRSVREKLRKTGS